ncbi:MAG: UDP-3-O-[3-hydroxymyristoyl] N-acetylglucosamine deacetylase [Planctomycetes bacterium]|nr:UDP-3-O-[3-hydroxymyristoyl] N-acetylglucosamine deacetylase [Planctomycetota bacterium]
MRNQRTIKDAVELSGVGLHTGAPVTLRIRPAPPDHGVIFVRTDVEDPPLIAASLDNLRRLERRTALAVERVEIQTIEHLLAALWAVQLDNAVIEMDAPEVPGADGSARPFVDALNQAGLVDQKAPKKTLVLDETVSVSAGSAALVALPSPDGAFGLSYTLDYASADGRALPVQHFECAELTPEVFIREVAPARTFCLEREAEELRSAGLGRGANYQNTLVIGASGGVIENELRYPDEFARHKVLDLIGDVFLLEADLKARIVATKTGHELNQKLVGELRRIMHDRENRDVLQHTGRIDINEIMRILPHRYPFLLVDRVIEVDGIRRAVGIKNVTVNEAYFQGHYPEQPIMPGVLQIEAMAQISGVLLLRKLENTGKIAVLASIDKVKLRKAVYPGDQLRLEAVSLRVKPAIGHVRATAKVNDKVVAEAELRFMLIDPAGGGAEA